MWITCGIYKWILKKPLSVRRATHYRKQFPPLPTLKHYKMSPQNCCHVRKNENKLCMTEVLTQSQQHVELHNAYAHQVVNSSARPKDSPSFSLVQYDTTQRNLKPFSFSSISNLLYDIILGQLSSKTNFLQKPHCDKPIKLSCVLQRFHKPTIRPRFELASCCGAVVSQEKGERTKRK